MLVVSQVYLELVCMSHRSSTWSRTPEHTLDAGQVRTAASPVTSCGQLHGAHGLYTAHMHLYTNTILISCSMHACFSIKHPICISALPRANNRPPDQPPRVLGSRPRLQGHAENSMSASSFCRIKHDLLCVHARSGDIPPHMHAPQRPSESRFNSVRPGILGQLIGHVSRMYFFDVG